MRATSLTIALMCSLSFSAANAATFCAWKVPLDAKPERFINLTVVQFIDMGDEEVKVSFGGGNLGSGYDIRIPTKNRDESNKILKSMQAAAELCDK